VRYIGNSTDCMEQRLPAVEVSARAVSLLNTDAVQMGIQKCSVLHTQWRRSVVKSEGVRVTPLTRVKPSN